MLASILLGLFSITAKELGKTIGTSSLSYGTGKVWAALAGQTNAEEFNQVNRRLDEVLGELNRVRSSISEVKTQIDDFHADIKMDDIDRYVNQIESLYDQYMAALDSLADAAKSAAAGNAGAEEARKASIRRLTKLGKRVADEVYGAVKQIDSLLSGTSNKPLFLLLHNNNIGRDFLAYFCAMKSVFIRYYLIQMKAVFIMGLVYEDKSVPFVDGKKLMRNVEDMLQGQERYLLTLIPDSVVQLVAAIAAAPEATPINFRSAIAGRSVSFGSYSTHLPSHVEAWQLEPMAPLTMSPKAEYRFLLRNLRSGHVLILSGSQYGAVADSDMRGLMGWRIRCTPDGRFLLEFCGNYYKGAFEGNRLVTLGSGSSKDQQLHYSTQKNDSDKYQQFFIEPYVSAFRGTDKLLSYERLLPGGFIESANRSHRLRYRENGNVDVVRVADDTVIWTATTSSPEPGWLIKQVDGNFVAHTKGGKPYWASGAYGSDKELHIYQHSVLQLHDDGTVDIRLPNQPPLWKI
ncbi:hypothetical protein [Burkholderia gladioli]|uniref:hypothetical protein n=1 Tax=Burkholderia gladioli TaxID=28095 RepID=UPI00164172AC|nr:hypothetical protein [Burkholderia gladioli]